jgi:4-amino-4-deoxy-L-arabinose transferase-like glycosyltransferase
LSRFILGQRSDNNSKGLGPYFYFDLSLYSRRILRWLSALLLIATAIKVSITHLKQDRQTDRNTYRRFLLILLVASAVYAVAFAQHYEIGPPVVYSSWLKVPYRVEKIEAVIAGMLLSPSVYRLLVIVTSTIGRYVG